MKLTKAPFILLLCSLLFCVSYSTTLRAKSQTRAEGGCYLNNNYGRGAGRPLNGCPSGYEQNGLLCYPVCRDGYYGAGPVCWQYCPAEFTDSGVDCTKPNAYGRGWGSIHGCGGCEKCLALYYPICRANYHPAGCNLCSPNCPGDMRDIGVGCQKNTYTRGAGIPMGCGANEDKSGALCYPQCRSGYNGIGPVCWTQCPAEYPTKCGALCLEAGGSCAATVVNMVLTGIEGTLEVAAEIEDPPAAILEGVKAGADLAEKLTYGGCY